ncbi:MAG: ClpXP protease specificity-enhancing factor SspB [Holosporales bacterium]|jgi:hypothetical protein|nr:ClpXP protease specificity-enhancing factor SspB [Holosporales bacterium]
MAKKIDYGELLKRASLSVMKDVLRHVAVNGLYKDQHLYITFSINHPGVKIADVLKDDDEMTIVLQYEFWDLRIDEYGFSVCLAFELSDETIYIPFSSILIFSDPSEDFCLEFTPDNTDTPPKPIEQSTDLGNNVISIESIRNNNVK